MNILKKIIASKAGKVAATAVGAGILYGAGIISETKVIDLMFNIGA